MDKPTATFLGLLFAGFLSVAQAAEPETVITFDSAQIGKPVPTWTAKAVVFELASAPVRSQAVGRVMFFPHLGSGKTGPDKIGILNAMAEEQAIPVQAYFPMGASSVTVSFWASTGCPALLEAFDKDGNLLDKASVDSAPSRKSPAEMEPNFELTVKGAAIAYVHFSGPRRGDFLAAEQVRFTPLPATAPSPAPTAAAATK